VPTVVELFSLAIQHHQAGKLDLAEQLYRQILQADASHADSHHLLGVIAYQTGRHAQAVASIQQALRLNPWAGIFYSNLGVVYEALGQKQEALKCFEQALRFQPQSAEAHNALGNVLRDVGRHQEALTHCLQAIQLRPDFPEAHDNAGNALYVQGKLDEAIAHYREALRLRPEFALVQGHLGLALADKGQVDEAMPHYDEALRLDPNSAEAHNNMSIALLKQGKLDEAVAHCQQALRVQPNFAGAHNNLSIALRRQGKLDDAGFHCKEAVRINPSFPEGHNSLATTLVRQACWEEALAHYHEAIRLKPNFPEARWNRAILWLALCNFEQGWPEYEWRWTQPGFTPRRFQQLAWDGSDLGGRTILLYTEQGLGDTLHFIRYAPLVKQLGATVLVQCQIPLARLLAGVPGIDKVVPEEVQPPNFDCQAALMSLPGILDTTSTTIPAAIPYLNADQVLVVQWQRELANYEVRSAKYDVKTLTSNLAPCLSPLAPLFKVAIGWQGSPTYGHDNLRSIPLKRFARLAQVEGVQLISLQKGPGTEQLPDVSYQLSDNRHLTTDTSYVLDLGSRLDDASGPFMDTAAVMRNVDLVISSDTAVAHLAGALGVPVWVPLPFVPDWRWHLEREDSPWYPTMRLFRQKRSDDWEVVFERMAHELKAATDQKQIKHG
jgi:tetratricopeptide (TPR) repeat protein